MYHSLVNSKGLKQNLKSIFPFLKKKLNELVTSSAIFLFVLQNSNLQIKPIKVKHMMSFKGGIIPAPLLFKFN